MSSPGPRDFICCPYCSDPVPVIRVGKVGLWARITRNRHTSPFYKMRSRKDSSSFYCTACRVSFRVVGGMTWKESMGSLK